MVEPPEELFRINGSIREYKFINLHGEPDSAILEPTDYLSHEKCPLDGTNLVMVYGGSQHCYCCEGPHIHISQDESKNESAIEGYSSKLKWDIERTRKKLTQLELIASLVNNRTSEIITKNRENSLYSKDIHKPNQSEQTLKI